MRVPQGQRKTCPTIRIDCHPFSLAHLEPRAARARQWRVTSARQRLLDLPRTGLLRQPTPLHRLSRLHRATGADLWIKRDDVGPVAMAGNKARKFDLVLAAAARDGADLLITTGAAQSNSARTGAAFAALLGLDCRLILSGDPPQEPTGNVLLDELLGARVDFIGDVDWPQLEAAVLDAAEQASAEGRRPVVAPVGCSSPLGALGFALAYLELEQQCRDAGLRPAAIVHASSSLGTHAGLLVGRALATDRFPVVGIDVAAIRPDLNRAADELARTAAALIGLDLPEPGAVILDGFLGPGYGAADAATAHAVDLLARTEAVITDPVYSGKGAAGALALAAGHDGPVVFWHTGGYHALFDPAHAGDLRGARRQQAPRSP